MKRAREDDEPPLAKYEIGKILGEGSFATVRLGQRKADGARFAVKLIDRSSMSLDEAKREADILATLGLHRHIVSLIEQARAQARSICSLSRLPPLHSRARAEQAPSPPALRSLSCQSRRCL